MAFDSVGDGSLRPYIYRHLKPAGQPAAGVGELLFRNAVRADEPDSDGLLSRESREVPMQSVQCELSGIVIPENVEPRIFLALITVGQAVILINPEFPVLSCIDRYCQPAPVILGSIFDLRPCRDDTSGLYENL